VVGAVAGECGFPDSRAGVSGVDLEVLEASMDF
jgi:hypothetical protein